MIMNPAVHPGRIIGHTTTAVLTGRDQRSGADPKSAALRYDDT
jgi:hypothetical protein